MKLDTANPLLILAASALVTSLLVPAGLAAVTGRSNAFIGSIEIRDPDGIHIHEIAPALAWPAFGLANFVAFAVFALLLILALRRLSRLQINRVILLSAVIWCVAIGVIVAVQTARFS